MASDFSLKVETQEKRLDTYLAKKLQISRALIQEQIASGKISVNGKVITKASSTLHEGDTVTGKTEEEPTDFLQAVEHPLDVIYEDEFLLAINKPQDMVVHPASAHKGETLVHYLLHHLKNSPSFTETSTVRPGIVHRLDKGTSGIILVAKNRKTLDSLSQLFQKREMEKHYEAVIWGVKKGQGTIRSAIGRDRRDRKKISSKTVKGRIAVTGWQERRSFAHFTHLELKPQTGRTHQLRVHLTEAGHPIVGDPTYGRGTSPKRRQDIAPVLLDFIEKLEHPFLHAKSLSFIHPETGKKIEFQAPRPPLFETFLKLLNEHDTHAG